MGVDSQTMLRRLSSVLVMVVLVAPAIAMCAGTTSPDRRECCPQEEMTADMAAPSTSMADSCCNMSDEASQRVPAPTSQTVASATPVTAPAPEWTFAISSNTPAMHVRTAPASVDHVPRHLLLSVLIV